MTMGGVTLYSFLQLVMIKVSSDQGLGSEGEKTEVGARYMMLNEADAAGCCCCCWAGGKPLP